MRVRQMEMRACGDVGSKEGCVGRDQRERRCVVCMVKNFAWAEGVGDLG